MVIGESFVTFSLSVLLKTVQEEKNVTTNEWFY